MKKYFCILLLMVAPIIFSEGLSAQKLWTLEECIGYALDNNLQIKRQELQTEVAKNNLDQSKLNFLPDLGAKGYHQIGTGPNQNNVSFDKVTSSAGSVSFGGNLNLFSGLQKIYNVKMNRFTYLGKMKNLEKAKNDISLTIASAYLQILFSNELLDVSKNQLVISDLQVEKTQKLVDVGNLAKGSLLEIQAQAAADEASVTSSQNQLNLSYISLAQILDLDTVSNFKIYIPSELNVPNNFIDDPDSIYRIAYNNLPEIKSAEFQLKSSQFQLAIARGVRYPTLDLSGSVGSNYNLKLSDSTGNIPISKQLNDQFYKQVSLTLNIPIFTKYVTQTNISNAKIGVKDNEFALKQAQLSLRKDIEQAYADALAAFQNYKSREKSAAAYEENFKYVQQKFDVGLINSVDYNVAKNNYTKAKSDFLQAKYEFIFKTKILEFYKGNVIKL
jgi:outer membrane protein